MAIQRHHGVRHLGIIMDGNRRWAKRRGLSALGSHRRGYEVFKKIAEACLDRGIEILTVYAFSTENWNRSKKEVAYLMSLLELALHKEITDLHQKGVRVVVIGRVDELPRRLQQQIRQAMQLTARNTRGTLQLAINYGGRCEIVDAVKRIVGAKIPPTSITEETVSDALYTSGQPDPDLIIRTSGEQRMSGFLPWQTVYSELCFVNKPWPQFTEKDLDEVLVEFQRRQRRFGE